MSYSLDRTCPECSAELFCSGELVYCPCCEYDNMDYITMVPSWDNEAIVTGYEYSVEVGL